MNESTDRGSLAVEANGKLARKFVLIADNNHRDAGYLSLLLQNFGYSASTVRTGLEAAELLSIAPPSLILSELVLPDMSGLDLIEKIQATAKPEIPLIIETKFHDIETEDQCRRAGAFACLNKPVQSTELYQAVQQALEPTPRANIRVPVSLSLSVDDLASEADAVTSLSDSGLFIRTLEPHPVGSIHAITFVLNGMVIRVDAEVLYVYRFGDASAEEPGMGMKFVNLSALDKDAIQHHISQSVLPPIPPDKQ